ncbi:MAG: glycine oxidase ThiO [Porticoccaceae bacterium]
MTPAAPRPERARRDSRRVAVVGAGIMGRVLTAHLLARGCTVTLFDRDPRDRGGAAAWTAAGMLAPWAELEAAEPQVHSLGRRSLELWPALIASLGAAVDFHQRGSLVVAHPSDHRELGHFRQRLARQGVADRDAKTVDRDALTTLEPALADTFGEALWLPGEAWLDTGKVMAALGAHLLARGVDWRAQTPVTALAPGRVSTARGDHAFDQVFDCRGLGARADIPALRGVRGEVLWLEAPEVALSRPVRLLHPRYRLYLVPRTDNRYVLGATQIESDDNGPVTVRSALELLSAAWSLHPGFAEARILHAEANCRPALDDNLPLIDSRPGLTRINGLFRHGYLLAPALAELACRAQVATILESRKP